MIKTISIVLVSVPEKGIPVARSAIDIRATMPAATIEPITILFDKSDMRQWPWSSDGEDRTAEHELPIQSAGFRDEDSESWPAVSGGKSRAVREEFHEVSIGIKHIQLGRSVGASLGSGDDFNLVGGEGLDRFFSAGDLEGDMPGPADRAVLGNEDLGCDVRPRGGRGDSVV